MIFIFKIFCILSGSFALTEAEFLNVTYASNALCSDFDCSGYNLFDAKTTRFTDGNPVVLAVEFSPCSYPLVLRVRLDSSDLRFKKLLKFHGQNEETVALATPVDCDYEGGKGKECCSRFQNPVHGNASRRLCGDNAGDEESFARLIVGWNAAQMPATYSLALEVNFTHIFQCGEFLPIPSVALRNYHVLECQYGSSSDAPVEVKGKGKGFLSNEGMGIVFPTVMAYLSLRDLIHKLRNPSVEDTAETDDGQRLDDLEEDSEEEGPIPSSPDSPGDQRNDIKL